MLEIKKTPCYMVVVECDTNDGDYISRVNELTEDEFELYKPVLEFIGKAPKHYGTGDFASNSLAEWLDEKFAVYGIDQDGGDMVFRFCPSGAYGFHTVEHVTILKK